MTVQSASIRHEPTGTQADVLVGFGFNCFRLLVESGGRTHDALWAVDDFRSGRERPSGSGIPILFPFPGRIKDARFQWQNKTFQLPERDGLGNAIHGFVHERSWRVIEQETDAITGQFQSSVDDPSLLERWPSDFCITVTHRVAARRLETRFHVENRGDVPMPCGLGAHPYFRLPEAADDVSRCIVRIPVTAQWELDQLNATGKVIPLADAAEYQRGFQLGHEEFDNVFTGLVASDEICEAAMTDPASRQTLKLSFSRGFRECVVYTPPHRKALCIEPYTCVPDAIRLEQAGFDAGQRVLEPGASFEESMRIEVVGDA